MDVCRVDLPVQGPTAQDEPGRQVACHLHSGAPAGVELPDLVAQ
jgi:hypothetical protein